LNIIYYFIVSGVRVNLPEDYRAKITASGQFALTTHGVEIYGVRVNLPEKL
jgi:hypothetical protein